MYEIVSTCSCGGGYRYARTDPPHPKRNANDLYPEHRVVMENILNRPLLGNEVVHHINGDKTDNRPENLQVMSQSDHGKLHRPKQDPLSMECPVCGKSFEITPHEARWRIKKSSVGVATCSRSCGNKASRMFKSNPLPATVTSE